MFNEILPRNKYIMNETCDGESRSVPVNFSNIRKISLKNLYFLIQVLSTFHKQRY